MFSDWQAKDITSVLHEKKGGYANNTKSMYGLAAKAEGEGVRIITGLKVTGFERGNGTDAVTAVVTERGTINCEQVIVARRPLDQSDLVDARPAQIGFNPQRRRPDA